MRDEETDDRRDEPRPAANDEDETMEGAQHEESPGGRPAANFDPTPYLRQLRGRGGGQDYLDVKWRLLWLRREHPDAEILTEHVQIDQTTAIFKATVTLPTGGRATGYGSETAGDFGDFIEKAETKAIGRALNALGYGAQFGDRAGDEAEAPPAPRPGSTPPAAVAPAPDSPSAPSRHPRPAPDAAPAPRAAAASARPAEGDPAPPRAAAPPIDIAAGRGRAAVARPADQAPAADPPRPRPHADAAATAGEADPDATAGRATEPDLAEYSWTAFWPWARGLGLNGPKAVEALIGRPTAGLTPAELRDLILAARGDG